MMTALLPVREKTSVGTRPGSGGDARCVATPSRPVHSDARNNARPPPSASPVTFDASLPSPTSTAFSGASSRCCWLVFPRNQGTSTTSTPVARRNRAITHATTITIFLSHFAIAHGRDRARDPRGRRARDDDARDDSVREDDAQVFDRPRDDF